MSDGFWQRLLFPNMPQRSQPVTTNAGVLAAPREPISDRGRPDYLIPLLTQTGMSQEDAVNLSLRLYSRYPEGVRGFHVPSGPYAPDKGAPTLIPNADTKVFDESGTGYPVPRHVPRPEPSGSKTSPGNRISLPDDPELRKAYLEMISGGST